MQGLKLVNSLFSSKKCIKFHIWIHSEPFIPFAQQQKKRGKGNFQSFLCHALLLYVIIQRCKYSEFIDY